MWKHREYTDFLVSNISRNNSINNWCGQKFGGMNRQTTVT